MYKASGNKIKNTVFESFSKEIEIIRAMKEKNTLKVTEDILCSPMCQVGSGLQSGGPAA